MNLTDHLELVCIQNDETHAVFRLTDGEKMTVLLGVDGQDHNEHGSIVIDVRTDPQFGVILTLQAFRLLPNGEYGPAPLQDLDTDVAGIKMVQIAP